jgi:DNA-binding NtrC family response regulator
MTRILIIDDDASTREFLRAALEAPERVLVAVADAEAALREVDIAFPHAVVCDLSLPGMDGLTFMRLLRDLDPDVPLVVCTGSYPELAAVKDAELGVISYLPKPLKLDELRRAVDAAESLSQRIAALRQELADTKALQ